MKRIIVAGAGHGGISAALNLVRAGFDVTVYEKNGRDGIGYDWVDCMRKETFEMTGFTRPDDSCFGPMADQGYYSRSKTVKVCVAHDYGGRLGYIERKLLLKHIIDEAEADGVRFVFNTEILSVLHDGTKVTGIRIKENGEEKDVLGDMVIDAAGMNSSVRGTLPDSFGVRQRAHAEETFCTWRGYFRKTREFTAEPKNTVYFFHCGRTGMDWAINDDGYVDILVGGFGKLTQEDIDEALDDFCRDYPIEREPFRGGYGDDIPLGRMLSVMVCNNYAAVGNSAFMTEPLSGSGIDMSMRCGKILADVIIGADGDYSAEKLWKYNYQSFKQHGEHQYNNIVIKSFLSFLTPDDMDFFFEHKIMTAKEIGGGGNTKYTVSDIISKASILSRPRLIPPLLGLLKKMMAFEKLKKVIPEAYNQTSVEKWKSEYSKVR